MLTLTNLLRIFAAKIEQASENTQQPYLSNSFYVYIDGILEEGMLWMKWHFHINVIICTQ
jgi:hypothetical protein